MRVSGWYNWSVTPPWWLGIAYRDKIGYMDYCVLKPFCWVIRIISVWFEEK